MKPEENIGAYLLILLCTTLLTYFIKWKLSRQHLYKLAAKIPNVNAFPLYPVIGHALCGLGDNEHHLKTIRLLSDDLAPPRLLWLGHKLLVVISRPEDLEVVLNSHKCLSKDDLYNLTKPFAGEGIFSSPVPKWKSHRRVIMPTFNRRILDEFVKTFSAQAEIFIKQLESKCGSLIDIFEYGFKFSLDVICETAMGGNLNIQTTESVIEQALSSEMDIVMIRMCNVLYHSDWIFKWTSHAKREKQNIDTFNKFILGVVEKKLLAYRKQAKNKKITNNEDEEKRRPVFLEQLIELSENGEHWTIEELQDEVATIMVGASDTSATVASFTLLLLAMHPDIQQKCYEEIIQILGPDRKLEHTDMHKFVYLEKVIKESMRLFPIAPAILRKVDEDMEVGGYTLPKGSGLLLSIIGVHYSEQCYKNPWSFDPERFSPGEISKRHKYAYLPFSGGPRNCIGITYGMMSLKTLLAVTLRKYRVETIYKDIKEIRLKQSIIIKAVEGFPVRLFNRN